MITLFKSREDIRKEKAYENAEFLTGINKERYINLFLGNMNGSDRLFISNLFIKAKFQLREVYQNLSNYNSEIRRCKKRIEIGLTKESLEDHEKYIQALEAAIEANHSSLKSYGPYLMHTLIPLLNQHFTEHEIVQLVGGAAALAEEIISTVVRLGLENKQGFAFNLIYHKGEYRWRKGRDKDSIDCARWEMPLFHCISDYIFNEIESNPKLKQATDEKMEELFGEGMVYATFDGEGNIIAKEKVIQDVKAKDLLLNFKDMQSKGIVSKLKKESVLDMDAEFKLKRMGDGFYQVENKEGTPVGKVMKK